MSDLSAEAMAILEAGRAALAPPEAVRVRVRAAVDARVAGPGAGGAAAGGGGIVKLVLLSCVGLAVVGAVVVAWRASRPAGEASVERKVEAAPPAPPSANAAPEPVVTELAPEQPAPKPRPRRPSAEAAPDLAKELAMLEEARAALRAGTPGDAIAALDRHSREIRAPQLEREALLLRAEALCADGDREAGKTILEGVENRWPAASGVEAVRSRCGAEPLVPRTRTH